MVEKYSRPPQSAREGAFSAKAFQVKPKLLLFCMPRLREGIAGGERFGGPPRMSQWLIREKSTFRRCPGTFPPLLRDVRRIRKRKR